ncbi:MAG: polyphenol oxidase family protein [Desulfobulbus sp.]|nr:polyphenol oxidase family protein [Desulfobulbus sp.]
MQRQTSVPYYSSNLLPVPHGCFSCTGGVSKPPFTSLNLSFYTGDHPENVRVNRSHALKALRLNHLISVKQVHGDRVLFAQKEHIDQEIEGFDAIISDLPGTGILIQQADCQAVLLWAPQPQAIAAIHCGWRGSVQGIIGKTIACMKQEYGVEPGTLRVVISPSLGPCCAEFINFRTELPEWMHSYQVRPHFFDFWAISRRQLEEAGVPDEHIDIAGICTRCNEQYFSYRRAVHTTNGITGRNGSIIGLPSV